MFHRATQKGGRNSCYTQQVMEKENQKIFERVNNLYRTKQGYHKKEQMEQDAASLSMYSRENQEEG